MREKIIRLFESTVDADIILARMYLLKAYPEIRKHIETITWGDEEIKHHLNMDDVERILDYKFERDGWVGIIYQEEDLYE